MTARHARPPDLVLFTLEFPYGSAIESFLEAELKVLAERFPRIYVLPSRRSGSKRRIPGNVELVEMDWLDDPPPGSKRRVLSSHQALDVMARTLRPNGSVVPYVKAPRLYADILARNLLKLEPLARFVRGRALEEAVFYDYWFENSTLALALLRRRGVIRTAVCRAHGFDLYDERWAGGVVPFRAVKSSGLDRVFAISEYGKRYLEARAPSLRGRVTVSRLGVRDPGQAGPPRSDDVPVVLTCSNLAPLKCVHLVPAVLAALGGPVRWIHLGDGPERERVVEAASQLGDTVSWELRGHVDSSEVHRLYREQHLDAFLSLSESEGLPVSMMEALSYGVPVVARGVGGVPELVNPSTGILLAPDSTPEAAARALREVIDENRFDPAVLRRFFKRTFDAATNFNELADALVAVSGGEGRL